MTDRERDELRDQLSEAMRHDPPPLDDSARTRIGEMISRAARQGRPYHAGEEGGHADDGEPLRLNAEIGKSETSKQSKGEAELRAEHKQGRNQPAGRRRGVGHRAEPEPHEEDKGQDCKRFSAGQSALESAQRRVKAGERAYSSIALLMQNQVSRDDSLAQARGDVALGLIEVYRALGGGWQ